MRRTSTLIFAALVARGNAQETYLRGGMASEDLDDIAQEATMERMLGEEASGHQAFSYSIPCIPEPGGMHLIEPCGKFLPDGNRSTYEVHFGTKLGSFTLSGYADSEVSKERWYTVLCTLAVQFLVCFPLVVLRFVNKPLFDAFFGNVPRADKDPTLSPAELKYLDELKMISTGDAFIAPVNYYRCLAMLQIANPPDVSYVLWVKLFVTAVIVASVQIGTPIYLLCDFFRRVQIVGIVPIFDMHPNTVPTHTLGVSIAVLLCYKSFSRRVEDAYDANIYIISRRYVDPSKTDVVVEGELKMPTDRTMLVTAEEPIPLRNKAIKHFWLGLSMALKMAMCIVTFVLCLCNVAVLKTMDMESIVTSVTALYLVADLDKTAIDMDSELKDRYRNYVGRLNYEDNMYHQATQDRYTLARKIFERILQVISLLIILAVPFIQFKDGELLIPSN